MHREGTETLTNLFSLFGFPSVLPLNNGKEFKDKTMSELCRKHNIKQVHHARGTSYAMNSRTGGKK